MHARLAAFIHGLCLTPACRRGARPTGCAGTHIMPGYCTKGVQCALAVAYDNGLLVLLVVRVLDHPVDDLAVLDDAPLRAHPRQPRVAPPLHSRVNACVSHCDESEHAACLTKARFQKATVPVPAWCNRKSFGSESSKLQSFRPVRESATFSKHTSLANDIRKAIFKLVCTRSGMSLAHVALVMLDGTSAFQQRITPLEIPRDRCCR